ncbi:hypothetical protein DP73_11640 [Desulfosporosinus sp. HMP52]|uniref:hypothetical protein n=1 Tax=Desulfosporosinus sp. HMP52 TaxID=1487923 RepID=UPI00051FDD5D|nr:hypothetical protein [Desulfosporosinus sp. HMP52]KGK88944.1 hypothetical protein DP73_11640 [Desulfosporosinus sp. HMP52]
MRFTGRTAGKRIIKVLMVLILFLIPMLYSPNILAAVPEDFHYVGEVSPGSPNSTGFFILEIEAEPNSVMDASLRDLRIFNKEGRETGYTRLQTQESKESLIPLEIINKGNIQGTDQYNFTLKGIPAGGAEITIRLDKPEYLVKAHILGSNDNEKWQEIGVQTLYGINDSNNQFTLRGLEYSFIKFEFAQPKGENLSVSSAGYKSLKKDKPEVDYSSFPILQEENGKTTTLTLDLKYANQNSRLMKLITGEKGFYRRAYLEASNDGQQWRRVTSGYLYRGTERGDESLSLEYPLTQARCLRVILQNDDNQPVKFSQAQIGLVPIRLLVKDEGDNGPFKIFWGNEQMAFPTYDAREVFLQSKIKEDDLQILFLKSYSVNSQYKEAKPPLTERFPFLLPLALGLAVLVVGIIQFRSFKKMS